LKALKSGECQTHPKKAVMIVLKQASSGRMQGKGRAKRGLFARVTGEAGNRGVRVGTGPEDGGRLGKFYSQWGLIPRSLLRNTGGVGDLFPHIRKDFKEKSSIPRSLLRGFFIFLRHIFYGIFFKEVKYACFN
jgi:hypothetical protein